MTAADPCGVHAGLLSGTLLVRATPPPSRATPPTSGGAVHAAAAALASLPPLADAACFDAALAAVRKAVDDAMSRGGSDGDVLRAAMAGMLSSAGGDGRRRRIALAFAPYSTRMAACRRAVWKAGIAEECVLEAYVMSHGSDDTL